MWILIIIHPNPDASWKCQGAEQIGLVLRGKAFTRHPRRAYGHLVWRTCSLVENVCISTFFDRFVILWIASKDQYFWSCSEWCSSKVSCITMHRHASPCIAMHRHASPISSWSRWLHNLMLVGCMRMWNIWMWVGQDFAHIQLLVSFRLGWFLDSPCLHDLPEGEKTVPL